MYCVRVAILLNLFLPVLLLQPAKISLLQPQGLRFEVPDENFRLVGIHYSINKPVTGVAAGDYNYDMTTKTGNNFVHENRAVTVRPGDVINYWVLGINKLGEGHHLSGLSYTVPVPTTTTTTTQPPVTNAPVVPVHQQSSGVSTSGGSTSGSSTSGGSTSGSSTSGGSTSGGSTSGGSTSGGSTSGSSTSGSSTSSGTINGGSTHFGTSNGGSSTGSTCSSYPCLIFEDNFDTLDQTVWQHEITAGGGGNWEFEYYLNNRSNSYCHDGLLFIKPTLTADRFGEEFLTKGLLDLHASGPYDTCTAGGDYGCQRVGSPEHLINPIQSARLRSSRGFSFKYGKIEVEAKLPLGDWLWPAIWMLPLRDEYGLWPASGEIDIMESRGNRHLTAQDGSSKGANHFESTLHFGPGFPLDPYETAHTEVTLPSGTLADDFHRYGVEWDENSIKFYFDGKETLNVTPDQEGFWKVGKLDQYPNMDNPWRYGTKMAPFDKPFYIIMNVAVGGTGGFFTDTLHNSPPKPWQDKSEFAPRDFWQHKNEWYPTWNPHERNGEDAALKVNYVRVWKMKP